MNPMCSSKSLILLFLFFSIASAQVKDVDEAELERQFKADLVSYNEYIDHLGHIVNSFGKTIDREMNLHLSGLHGHLHGKVEKIILDFSAQRRATIDEARAFILAIMEKFLETINADTRIQPYLEVRPFTRNQVNISIDFKELDNWPQSDGSLASVLSSVPYEEPNYRILYMTYDPYLGSHNDIYQETYDEAVQRLQNNPISNLAVHTVPDDVKAREEAIDQFLQSFRTEMLNKHNLMPCSVGGKMAHKIEGVGARFVAFQRATQDDARELQITVAEKLLSAINSNDKLRPYLSEYPFPIERVKMQIEFRDGNWRSYPERIDTLILFGGNLYYYLNSPYRYSEPDPEFSAKESYAEAKELAESIPPRKLTFPPISDMARYVKASFNGFIRGLYEVTAIEIGVSYAILNKTIEGDQ